MSARSPRWSPGAQGFIVSVIKRLAPVFEGKGPDQANQVAAGMIDDALSAYDRDPGTPSIACQSEDCFGCCLHQKEIDTSAFEVDRILDRLHAQDRMAEIVRRARRLARHRTGGACPLLGRDGKCTVYDIRPLTCRFYHSLDRVACHSGPKAEIPHAERLWIETALIAGFGMHGSKAMTSGSAPASFGLFKNLAERGDDRLKSSEAA